MSKLVVQPWGKDHYRLLEDDELLLEANAFLDALRLRGLSPLTIRSYAYDLVVFYRWLRKDNLYLVKLTEPDLLKFVAVQREAHAAARSINRRLCSIRSLFRFSTGHELQTGPGLCLPAPHYKGRGLDHHLGLHALHKPRRLSLRVKEPHHLVEPLTPEQVRSFLRSLRRYRDLTIVHLMLLCGLRSREVLSLDTSDLACARIRVHGKGQRERVLPLPELSIRSLRRYLDHERPRRSPSSRLFLVLQGATRGKPMTVEGLRSLFRLRRLKPSLKSANPHRFRHTFGADMARAGVRLHLLQRLMGHADPKVTLQYINLSLEDVADEYRRALAELDKRYGGR